MWDFLFIISIILNVFLFAKVRELKAQLEFYKKITRKNNSSGTINKSLIVTHNASEYIAPAYKIADKQPLNALEMALDQEIQLSDSTVDKVTIARPIEPIEPIEPIDRESRLASLLQSISGWHKAFIPFLLQNIGWFIGILCFISGSIFFVSYTQGFSKSLTIAYTILSYTLLLAWGGYHLKQKVTHAAGSGMVLLAISFLLIPLNFSALGRLLTISLDNGLFTIQLLVSAGSALIASVLLYYITKLISGLFNRQLLNYFSLIFFSLSIIQLLVPLISHSRSIIILLFLFAIIMMLLLLVIVYYLPAVLQQVFVDKKYLVLFTVGSLIFTALVSIIHLGISSPLTVPLSFYAPFVLLLSMVLFYIDQQLHNYKQQGGLLSYFSLVCYALSFLAIVLSFDLFFVRLITISLAIVVYLRLMWLYRSLVPLYLVLILTAFLYVELFLSGHNYNLRITSQWLYLSLLPLLLLYSALFLFLTRNVKRSEHKRQKSLQLTRHLLHSIIIVSIVTGVVSQWTVQDYSLTLLNAMLLLVSVFYLLVSEKAGALELFGLKYHRLYFYIVTLLAGVLILGSQPVAVEVKLILLTVFTLFYALNSHYRLISFYKKTPDLQCLERMVFVNSSLLFSLLLLVLTAIGFSLSIKVALLIFILAVNSLFLSLSLYNRALFYSFMLLLSLSAVIFKLYIDTPASSGLMLISIVLVLFYFVLFLDKNSKTELEIERVNQLRAYTPEKILWFYPVHDFCPVKESKEGLENV